MAGKSRTPNFRLILPNFNQVTWHEDFFSNMRAIDGVLSRFFNIANYVGEWENATSYSVGDRVLDSGLALIFECNVAHTSSPEPATFLDDRTSNPSYWEVFTTEIQFRGEWEAGNEYAAGDFVKYTPNDALNRFAVAATGHTAGNDFDSDVSNGLWDVILSASDLENAELAAIEALSGTGALVRIGTGSYATREIVISGDGLGITDGDGVSGNPTITVADDLAAVEGLSGTGLAARTASNTWANRSVAASGSGLSVTNGDGAAGNPTVSIADDLSAIEALSGTGIATRTGTDAWTNRAIQGGSTIGVTNGDGASGDPTIDDSSLGTAAQEDVASGGTGDLLREDGPSAVPTGAVFWFAADTAPNGYAKCDGSAISRTTFSALFNIVGTTFGSGDGSTTFNLPDLRGEFVRGWDDGRGVDSGRALGSWQDFQMQDHKHVGAKDSGNDASAGSSTGTTGDQEETGLVLPGYKAGPETRPRNIALLPCIKT